jgi:hypothetical protein
MVRAAARIGEKRKRGVGRILTSPDTPYHLFLSHPPLSPQILSSTSRPLAGKRHTDVQWATAASATASRLHLLPRATLLHLR